MSKDFDLKFKCGLNVDDLSAEIALKIVNVYCRDNCLRIKENSDLSDMKLEFIPQNVGCTDCCGQRDNTIYTYSGKRKTALFCPTCGRKLQN